MSGMRHSVPSLDASAEPNLLSSPCLIGLSSPWEQGQKGPSSERGRCSFTEFGKAKASFCSQFQEFWGLARLLLSS